MCRCFDMSIITTYIMISILCFLRFLCFKFISSKTWAEGHSVESSHFCSIHLIELNCVHKINLLIKLSSLFVHRFTGVELVWLYKSDRHHPDPCFKLEGTTVLKSLTLPSGL